MKFKRFMALAMAGVMTLGMTGTAFAASSATPDVKKTVTAPEGVTVPATTFVFGGDQVDNPAPEGGSAAISPILNLSIKAEVTTEEAKVTSKEYSAQFTITDSEGAEVDLKNGEYTFKISEQGLKEGEEIKPLPQTDNDGYGWTGVDLKAQFLHVYVTNDGMTCVATDENTILPTGDEGKKAAIEFTNKFTKKAGSDTEDKHSLVISKTVTGGSAAYANKFTFTVTFDNLPDEGYEYTIGQTTGKIDKDNTTLELANGESAVFDKIPAGEHVTVVEAQDSMVTGTTVTVTSDGVQGTATEALTTGKFLLGENANIAEFSNAYQDIQITGLALNVAPFVAMFAAVAGAIALYIAAKRRVR